MKNCWLMIPILTTFGAYAQDTHYWTQQFGSRSALLSGAVVGGTADNTMVFYNPGALGFLENPSISINANVYRIENIRIFNALGQQADFRSSQFATVPVLAGGMLNIKSEKQPPKWKIGYAFMAPVDFSFKGIARVDGQYALVDDPESPGNEDLVGESGITSKLSEVALGIGIGRMLNEKWSVGVTHLFTVRSHTYNRNFLAHMFLNDENQTLVSATRIQNMDYFNLRYAAKIGLAYRTSAWSWGVTFTTPSVRMIGNGTVAADVSVHNLKINGSERMDGVASDRQSKLKSTYRSPVSISAGVNHAGKRSAWGLTMQYYGEVGEYDILRAKPSAFVRPGDLYEDLGSEEFLRVPSAALPVINVAVGYEYLLKEKITLLLSMRNDMSYYDDKLADEPGIQTSITSWDIYHVVAGTTISHEQSSLSLGLLFSRGKNDSYRQEGNLGNPSEGNLLRGTTTITKATYFSIGLLLGYTFSFKKF